MKDWLEDALSITDHLTTMGRRLMPEDKVIEDFDRHRANLDAIYEFLDKLYYSDEFSNIFTRPVLSTLQTATRYLSDNLIVLKQRYVSKIR